MSAETRVLYNGDCPVCSYEIGHYAAYTRMKDIPVRYDSLTEADALQEWDLNPEQAARRLHVLHGGEMLSGIPAFLVLWRQMPRYAWLARIVGLPVVRQAACAVYDYILAPALYHWHLRRMRRLAKD